MTQKHGARMAARLRQRHALDLVLESYRCVQDGPSCTTT
jgi:hypothetical protein